jgi:YebC/PmpR family DNA-binding regulatory protein
MAGHSQFKNIMYRKGAQDAKKAKIFTKLIRELTVSARSSPDPESNPRLRAAIIAARQANMPKDTMDRAIARGSGPSATDNYESVRYEGYGPGGVALIVEALTDNRNRTAPEVRTAFSKFGGSLGETNSVSFQFEHVGQIEYTQAPISAEALFDLAIEAGAEDVIQEEGVHQIFTHVNDLHKVRDFLAAELGDPASCKLVWRPQNLVKIEGETARSLLKLIDLLEDNDDVQAVFSNFDIDPSALEGLIP